MIQRSTLATRPWLLIHPASHHLYAEPVTPSETYLESVAVANLPVLPCMCSKRQMTSVILALLLACRSMGISLFK